MKITLVEKEIANALIQYITNQGINTENATVRVDMIAGRKDTGHSAELDITPLAKEGPCIPQETPKETKLEEDKSLNLNGAESSYNAGIEEKASSEIFPA